MHYCLDLFVGTLVCPGILQLSISQSRKWIKYNRLLADTPKRREFMDSPSRVNATCVAWCCIMLHDFFQGPSNSSCKYNSEWIFWFDLKRLVVSNLFGSLLLWTPKFWCFRGRFLWLGQRSLRGLAEKVWIIVVARKMCDLRQMRYAKVGFPAKSVSHWRRAGPTPKLASFCAHVFSFGGISGWKKLTNGGTSMPRINRWRGVKRGRFTDATMLADWILGWCRFFHRLAISGGSEFVLYNLLSSCAGFPGLSFNRSPMIPW